MATLLNKATGNTLGDISESDLERLMDVLEEEDDVDVDYFICRDTLEILEQNGAPNSLLGLLAEGIGTSDGIEVSWSNT